MITMKLKNTTVLSTQDIKDILDKYSNHFTVEYDGGMEIVKGAYDYPFANSSKGILIAEPNLKEGDVKYGGLTYVYGAVSIYTYPDERVRWGHKTRYLLENRLIHEILHHFDKPCHDLAIWLSEFHPFLFILYLLVDKNGESLIGMFCERIFYKHLLADVNEEEFDIDYFIEDRNYEGKL